MIKNIATECSVCAKAETELNGLDVEDLSRLVSGSPGTETTIELEAKTDMPVKERSPAQLVGLYQEDVVQLGLCPMVLVYTRLLTVIGQVKAQIIAAVADVFILEAFQAVLFLQIIAAFLAPVRVLLRTFGTTGNRHVGIYLIDAP